MAILFGRVEKLPVRQSEGIIASLQMCHTSVQQFVTQCGTGQNDLRCNYTARLPCECWSRGLGGGPMPLRPPCLIVSPFIWLKRLSSFMLFSCMLSTGCRRMISALTLNRQPRSNENIVLGKHLENTKEHSQDATSALWTLTLHKKKQHWMYAGIYLCLIKGIYMFQCQWKMHQYSYFSCM